MRLIFQASIPGRPQPKERPRSRKGGGKPRSGSRTAKWEKHARKTLQFARQQAGRSEPFPREWPLHLEAVFVYPRTQSLPRQGSRVRHYTLTDLDNLLKALLDAADGSQPAKKPKDGTPGHPGTPGLIISNDCQIASFTASKWYAAAGEEPGVHLRLFRLDADPGQGVSTLVANLPQASSRSTSPPVAGPPENACGKFATSVPARPDATAAAPLLRWAGGKRWLCKHLLPMLPAQRFRYVAPFVGAGAVFWALAAAGRLNGALLADANPVLITLYRVLRDQPAALLQAVAAHRDQHSAAHFLAARDALNDRIRPQPTLLSSPSPAEEGDADVVLAALLVYLNATCHSGLWRLNQRGEFNTSQAADRTAHHVLNPTRERRLWACSAALQGVELRCADFSTVLPEAAAGDLVYADSPYIGTFDRYTAAGFSDAQHRTLATLLDAARQRGAWVAASNSDRPLAHQLYPPSRWHHHHGLSRKGNMDPRGEHRERVPELLLTSWPGGDRG